MGRCDASQQREPVAKCNVGVRAAGERSKLGLGPDQESTVYGLPGTIGRCQFFDFQLQPDPATGELGKVGDQAADTDLRTVMEVELARRVQKVRATPRQAEKHAPCEE